MHPQYSTPPTLNVCACGCGQATPNRFVHGHNSRNYRRDLRHTWKYNAYRLEGTTAILYLKNREGIVVAEGRLDAADLDAVLPLCHWGILRAKTEGLCYVRGIARGLDAPSGRRKPAILLHRFLMQPGPGLEVDHIDGDGLNCVRSNMRIVTRGQNSHNRPFHRRILMLEEEVARLRALLNG